MKTKRMRGYQWLTGWMLLMASAPGKKWSPGKEISAWGAMLAFVVSRKSNLSWDNYVKGQKTEHRNGPPSPLRLLGPGGIIVAESHTRRRKPRKARNALIPTAKHRTSIAASSPLAMTGTLRGSGIGGYPFLTMRDPRKPRRA
jgi:hypothetical protein